MHHGERDADLVGVGDRADAALLGRVRPDVAIRPALVIAAFMTTPQEDLLARSRAITPSEWLAAGGEPQRVARLASMLGTPA